MKRLYNIKAIMLFVTLLLVTSCSDYLDVNTNPNFPPAVPQEQVFPAAVVSATAIVGCNYATVGGLWSQFWTQSPDANQYKDIDSYNINNGTMDSWVWTEIWAGALNDFRYSREQAVKSENWSLALMNTVMESFVYQVLADFYDKIPYTEACNGEATGVIAPKWDDGSVVYDGLIKNIDLALSRNFSATTSKNIGSNDFIFGGNVSKWIAFANTLKLKIYLRQVYARPQVAEAGIKALFDSKATFLNEDAAFIYFTESVNKQNPLYGYEYQNLGGINLGASATMFDFLSVNADPRLNKYYKPNTTGGFKPQKQGDFLNNANKGQIAIANVTKAEAVKFMSKAESYFLQAEALERYYGGLNAKSMYDNGVLAAFTAQGFDGAPFIADGGAYVYPNSGNFETKLKAIITQKWTSMPNSQGYESFFEFNRTGYPDFFTVSVETAISGGKFPKRLLFPVTESGRNPNTPEQVPVDIKVWWDKKN